jgi:hypothetical protein
LSTAAACAAPFANTCVHAHGVTPGLTRLDTGTVVLRYDLALSIFLADADLDRLVAAISALRDAEARTGTDAA